MWISGVLHCSDSIPHIPTSRNRTQFFHKTLVVRNVVRIALRLLVSDLHVLCVLNVCSIFTEPFGKETTLFCVTFRNAGLFCRAKELQLYTNVT